MRPEKKKIMPGLNPAFRPRIADVLRALGHEARLHILEVLASGEHTVSELQSELELSQSTVSQHMAVLRHARIVTARRDGTRRLYSLANDHLVDLLRCLASCQAHCVNPNP